MHNMLASVPLKHIVIRTCITYLNVSMSFCFCFFSYHTDVYLWKRCELVEVLDGTKQLQADAGCDDQQTHSEQHQTTQFLSWTEYLQGKPEKSITWIPTTAQSITCDLQQF